MKPRCRFLLLPHPNHDNEVIMLVQRPFQSYWIHPGTHKVVFLCLEGDGKLCRTTWGKRPVSRWKAPGVPEPDLSPCPGLRYLPQQSRVNRVYHQGVSVLTKHTGWTLYSFISSIRLQVIPAPDLVPNTGDTLKYLLKKWKKHVFQPLFWNIREGWVPCVTSLEKALLTHKYFFLISWG